MIQNIIIDSSLGLIFIVLFSIFVNYQPTNSAKWSNIMTFICYAPTLYFYLLYLVLFRSNNRQVFIGFVDNCTLGMIITFICLIITYILIKNKFTKLNIFMVTLIITIISFIFYIYFRMFDKKSLLI